MASQKTHVIERIFSERWNAETNTLSHTMVTMEEVKIAIRWCNEHKGTTLSDANPANFIKDIIRGEGASAMWPSRLHELRWSAEQETGGGNIFEFIPYDQGQTEPFPNHYVYRDTLTTHRVQSLTIPDAAKALGRGDETYLIQVAAKLALVETHLALESDLEVVEVTHLQIGVKLRLTELDSVYAATLRKADGSTERIIITCEAKADGQRILEGQIKRQVEAAFNLTDVDLVVPLAMAASNGGVYIIEFASVRRNAIATFATRPSKSEAFYELIPKVKGI